MTKRYKSVELDEAAEGAQLFEDVLDRQGAVLVAARTELTASLIRSLQRRGIDTVIVADDSMSPEALEEARAKVAARLERLFARSGGRASAELRRQVMEYRLEQLS
ncbi:MAG TPA: hypothetical protein VFT37_04895 [Telluria sp.]|nr:hypothetical protein [Telluria sp.]